MSVIVKAQPEVPASERLVVEDLTHGIYRVKAYYGFLQTPNVEEIRARCADAMAAMESAATDATIGYADGRRAGRRCHHPAGDLLRSRRGNW